MIPNKKFEKFGEFYYELITPNRSKYFLQNRNDNRTIFVNLKAAKGQKGFGWLEITPISFTEIYINASQSVVNPKQHYFILNSMQEALDLFEMLYQDPNSELPEALEFEDEEVEEVLEYEEEHEPEYEEEEEDEYEVEEELEYEYEEEEELEYEEEEEFETKTKPKQPTKQSIKPQVQVSIVKDKKDINEGIQNLEQEFEKIVRKNKKEESEKDRRFLF